MTPSNDLIGTSPRRKEDRRLLTGAGRYVDDLRRPGLLHMAVVRSRHAHARVIKIGVEAARSLPGASEDEVGLRFVERHYGRELASELRHFLAARRP